jgi:AraC-like DNA-binding protein
MEMRALHPDPLHHMVAQEIVREAPGGPPPDVERGAWTWASAAYRVGYRDASHFNWERKSLFGAPPMRDVHRLRMQVQMAGVALIS